MLATFSIILGLLLLGCVLGKDVLRCVSAEVERFSPVSVVWVGLGVWSCCLLGVALFTGIPASVYLVAAAYVVLRLGFGRQGWTTRGCLRSVGLPLAAAVTACLYSFRGIGSFDAWLYQMNAVKWYGAYGIVPGLALLQNRFGYPSSWFALDASLNHGPLAGRVYGLTGLLILTLLIWQALACLDALRRRVGALSDLVFPTAFLGVFLACWKSRIIVSCCPDFAVIGLTLQIIHEASRRLLGRVAGGVVTADMALFLVVAAIGYSFKLSFLGFLPLVGVVYLWKLGREGPSVLGRAVLPLGMTVFILAVCMAASVRASGFPFFPIAIGRLDLPWSLTVDEAAGVQREIMLNSRYCGNPPQGFWPWIWATTQPVWAATVVCAAVAVLALTVDRRGGARFLAAMGGLGIAIFLLKAPDMKFDLGLFWGLISVALFLRLQPWLESVFRADRARPAAPLLWLAGSAGLLLLVGSAAWYRSPSERIDRQITLANQAAPAREMVVPLVPVQVTGPDLLQLSVAQYEVRTAQSGMKYSVLIGDPGQGPGIHDLMGTFGLTTENIAFRDPQEGLAGGFCRTK